MYDCLDYISVFLLKCDVCCRACVCDSTGVVTSHAYMHLMSGTEAGNHFSFLPPVLRFLDAKKANRL